MVLDANLKLHDAIVNANSNGFSVTGSEGWINLGRAGLPRGAQLFLSVPTLHADRELTATLQATYDNGSTIRTVAVLTVPVRAAGIIGRSKIMTVGVSQEAYLEGYERNNIDARVVITAPNHVNDANFGQVQVFLGVGEKGVGLGSDL